jgi:hypothetical protein
MRFIIREQEYEQLVAAGRLTYRSGTLESYRLTEAAEGFQVMRVDLDRRSSDTEDSLLIHILLDSSQHLERLKMRELSPDNSVNVDALAGVGLLSISREDQHGVEYSELEQPLGFGLLLPGFIGLGLVLNYSEKGSVTSLIALDIEKNYKPTMVSMEIDKLNEESLAVTGQKLAVRPYLIRLKQATYTIWLDRHGIPVRVDDEVGTLALEDRYVRHR